MGALGLSTGALRGAAVGGLAGAEYKVGSHQLPVTEIPPIAGETLGTMYLVWPYSYIGLAAAAFSEAKF